VLCVILSALILNFTPDCAAQTEAKPAPGNPPPAKAKGAGEEVDSPTAKGDRLRRPGFLFLELDCHDLEEAIAFFHDVAGFEINRNDGNFVILRSERGELLLNRRGAAPKGNAPGAQPVAKVQGPRVEIGIVVDDLDKAFAAAQKHPSWTIADRIARQSWGVRDFRVWSPERYYLRITEGPR
jgi:catechol 2,3-dioxygenase-like lactoylglutathione lyase family enzyme